MVKAALVCRQREFVSAFFLPVDISGGHNDPEAFLLGVIAGQLARGARYYNCNLQRSSTTFRASVPDRLD